ncbi:MAG TPA: L-histidine N(alpha)-methyltransferase [Candidatus Methylacidiphilales bacterium]|nr:L-histidine N(alpha)-methyltransferase [Candidatus Methylacidiphilales bacterium]
MVEIDFHSSFGSEALRRGFAAALRENRLDPKFLYLTPRQAALWREVFQRHSPIHDNPEFARIYREAFARIAKQTGAKKIFLAGLGCGTGLKEHDLHSALAAHGAEVLFAAVDASHDLVRESVKRLAVAGAAQRRSLVCDLAETGNLGRWLENVGGDLPRVMTFFGLVPNLSPPLAARIFRAVLRSGDLLLASAHLVPVTGQDPGEIGAAMKAILPQYDNPETLAWLGAALEEAGLVDLAGPPEMKIGEIEGIPAFIASARWKSEAPVERWGERFVPKPDEPLRLFHSLRYTPALFGDLLRREGFEARLLAFTPCRQEAIWSIRLG